MKRLALAALLLALPALAEPTADENVGPDLAVKMGATLGTIKRAASDAFGGQVDLNYGGVPVALSYNRDITRSLTLQAEIHIVADMGNNQVSETSINIGVVYHLLGGSRRTVNELGFATVVVRDSYNFSLIGRPSYGKYGVSDGTTEINGSTFEVMAGGQLRYDLGDRTCIGAEVLTTMVSLPASNERVTASRFEVLGFFRFFL